MGRTGFFGEPLSPERERELDEKDRIRQIENVQFARWVDEHLEDPLKHDVLRTLLEDAWADAGKRIEDGQPVFWWQWGYCSYGQEDGAA